MKGGGGDRGGLKVSSSCSTSLSSSVSGFKEDASRPCTCGHLSQSSSNSANSSTSSSSATIVTVSGQDRPSPLGSKEQASRGVGAHPTVPGCTYTGEDQVALRDGGGGTGECQGSSGQPLSAHRSLPSSSSCRDDAALLLASPGPSASSSPSGESPPVGGRAVPTRQVAEEEEEGETLYAVKGILKSSVVTQKQAEHLWNERQLSEAITGMPEVQCSTQRFVETLKTSSSIYFVFEAVTGGPLHRHIRFEGGFPCERVRWYSAELVLILEALHARGILYRDLQASNILIAHDGRLKLVDFGLAKDLNASRLKRTRSYCGTLHAMAPEILAVSGGMMGGGVKKKSSSSSSSPPRSCSKSASLHSRSKYSSTGNKGKERGTGNAGGGGERIRKSFFGVVGGAVRGGGGEKRHQGSSSSSSSSSSNSSNDKEGAEKLKSKGDRRGAGDHEQKKQKEADGGGREEGTGGAQQQGRRGGGISKEEGGGGGGEGAGTTGKTQQSVATREKEADEKPRGQREKEEDKQEKEEEDDEEEEEGYTFTADWWALGIAIFEMFYK